jgi:hypothetical protein
MTDAAIVENSPAAVLKATPIDSPRDRVECVSESPVTRSIERNDPSSIILIGGYLESWLNALGDSQQTNYTI